VHADCQRIGVVTAIEIAAYQARSSSAVGLRPMIMDASWNGHRDSSIGRRRGPGRECAAHRHRSGKGNPARTSSSHMKSAAANKHRRVMARAEARNALAKITSDSCLRIAGVYFDRSGTA
jgi:hypothetical protein